MAHALRAALLVSALVVGITAAVPVTAGGGPSQHSVEVTQVTVDMPGGEPMDAYLVQPDGRGRPHAYAGILYLHWFEPGHASADSSEFLPEAIEMAERGVVSLLPQQRFPWSGNPVGDDRDLAAVTAGVEDARAALDYLVGLRSVDTDRVAVVGHDYGAMYGTLVAQADPRVTATVLVALDATWANWFDEFWLHLGGEEEAAYVELFAGLDPVDNVGRLDDEQLFQWAEVDLFIPPAVRVQFAVAAPMSPAITYSGVGVDHSLDLTAAETDRTEFLGEELHLDG